MKKLFLLLFLFFSFSILAQQTEKITSKKCISKKGYHLKLKSVFDDSRCPEGVNCVWAGEVSVKIEVFKDKKLIEEKTMLFNSKNKQENVKWFENYLSNTIESISVFPHPKEGIVVQSMKQFILITYNN